MTLVEFIIFAVIVTVIFLLIERFIRNKYKIPKRKEISNYVNDFHKKLHWIVAITIIVINIILFALEIIELSHMVFHALIITLFIRIYMERKYRKEYKMYIIYTVGTITFVILYIGALSLHIN